MSGCGRALLRPTGIAPRAGSSDLSCAGDAYSTMSMAEGPNTSKSFIAAVGSPDQPRPRTCRRLRRPNRNRNASNDAVKPQPLRLRRSARNAVLAGTTVELDAYRNGSLSPIAESLGHLPHRRMVAGSRVPDGAAKILLVTTASPQAIGLTSSLQR